MPQFNFSFLSPSRQGERQPLLPTTPSSSLNNSENDTAVVHASYNAVEADNGAGASLSLLEGLPEDLKGVVFSFFSLPDRAKLAKLSRSFHSSVLESYTPQEKYALNTIPCLSTMTQAQIVPLQNTLHHPLLIAAAQQELSQLSHMRRIQQTLTASRSYPGIILNIALPSFFCTSILLGIIIFVSDYPPSPCDPQKIKDCVAYGRLTRFDFNMLLAFLIISGLCALLFCSGRFTAMLFRRRLAAREALEDPPLMPVPAVAQPGVAVVPFAGNAGIGEREAAPAVDQNGAAAPRVDEAEGLAQGPILQANGLV